MLTSYSYKTPALSILQSIASLVESLVQQVEAHQSFLASSLQCVSSAVLQLLLLYLLLSLLFVHHSSLDCILDLEYYRLGDPLCCSRVQPGAPLRRLYQAYAPDFTKK